jgi:exodeoxyribonuclease VII small subunit
MVEKDKAVDQLSYEEALGELEEILETLEGEARGLDETMSLFERGRALVKHCQTLLEHADLKVRQLDQDDEIQDLEE